MSTSGGMVVVGAGQAAATAVEELRASGYDRRVTVIGAEPHLPYDRPPLSKGVLTGERDPATTVLLSPDWYDAHDVEVRTRTTATALDLQAGVVHTDRGRFAYDRLLLATGSAPRRIPAVDGSGVPAHHLRTLDDARALSDALDGRPRVLVVGGGWIGLEVAAAARTRGAEVTVLETQRLPLLGALGERAGSVLADLHRDHGVDLRLGAGLAAVSAAPSGEAVVGLTDGVEVAADLVLVCVGARPRTELARAAGLATEDGVLVDAALRTSDPRVFAAGDIALHDHPLLGRRIRVEHWDNAREQGRVAAQNMLGARLAYERLPYFFSDQYDLGLEYVGHVAPGTRPEVVERGHLDDRKGVLLWHDAGRVVAGMHLNEWDATDHLRALVGTVVPPERLADPSVGLAELAASVS